MCTNLHDNARRYAEEKNERLLLIPSCARPDDGKGYYCGLADD